MLLCIWQNIKPRKRLMQNLLLLTFTMAYFPQMFVILTNYSLSYLFWKGFSIIIWSPFDASTVIFLSGVQMKTCKIKTGTLSYLYYNQSRDESNSSHLGKLLKKASYEKQFVHKIVKSKKYLYIIHCLHQILPARSALSISSFSKKWCSLNSVCVMGQTSSGWNCRPMNNTNRNPQCLLAHVGLLLHFI